MGCQCGQENVRHTLLTLVVVSLFINPDRVVTYRFVESEEWRNNLTVWDPATGAYRPMSLAPEDPEKNPPTEPLKLDELVRTWDKDGSFKRELSKYYKQFYHKTDKV